jgi:hypothetical protein
VVPGVPVSVLKMFASSVTVGIVLYTTNSNSCTAELDVVSELSNCQTVAVLMEDSLHCCVQLLVNDHTVVKKTEPVARGGSVY